MTLGRGNGGRPPDRDVQRQPTTSGGRTRGGEGAVPALLASGRGPVTLTQHSWLSQIVVACCKSNNGTTKARRYRCLKQSDERKTYPLPGTKENPIVQVDESRNYYPTSFNFAPLALLSKNHKKVLPGTSLFHLEASVNKPNQVKENWPPRPPISTTPRLASFGWTQVTVAPQERSRILRMDAGDGGAHPAQRQHSA